MKFNKHEAATLEKQTKLRHPNGDIEQWLGKETVKRDKHLKEQKLFIL